MTSDNANDNTPRPAAFDAAVMAYMPALRKLAIRLVPRGEREDLIQDTLIVALSKWCNFRSNVPADSCANPYGKGSGIHNWITWQMYGVRQNQRTRKKLKTVSDVAFAGGNSRRLAIDANQETAADLSIVMRAVDSCSFGGNLMLAAAGYNNKEIGVMDGVSTQAVHQRVRVARGKVARKLGRAA